MDQQQLEPMSISRILDKTFTIYRCNFVRFITIVALIQVPIGLIGLLFTAIAQQGVPLGATEGIGRSPASDVAGAPMRIMFVGLIAWLLAFVASMLCQAALTKSVSESYLSREISVGQAYRFVLPKVLTLVAAALLTALIVGVGFLLLVVPGVIFSLWFYLTTPCIVVEGHGAIRGMSRSRALVSGNLGKVFLVGLLVLLITWAIAMPLGAVSGFLTAFILRDNLMLKAFVQQFATVISQILAAPIGASAFILLYYDLRIRKEGFDLEMLAQSMSSEEKVNDVAPPY